MESTATINILQYNKFYKDHKRGVYYFILKMTHSIEISEEITNDVFVKLYQSLSRFDATQSSMKTWVYNIAKNATIDHLRKKRLATQSMFDVMPNSDGEYQPMDFAGADADPLAQLINSEGVAKVAVAIKGLPAQQAEVLTQYAMGYTYEQIAEELSMSIGTVKGSIHLARTKIKEQFPTPVLA